MIGRRGFQPWRDSAHGQLRSLYTTVMVMTMAMTTMTTRTHVTTNNNNTPTHHMTNNHNDRRHAPYDNDSDLTLYDLGAFSDSSGCDTGSERWEECLPEPELKTFFAGMQGKGGGKGGGDTAASCSSSVSLCFTCGKPEHISKDGTQKAQGLTR